MLPLDNHSKCCVLGIEIIYCISYRLIVADLVVSSESTICQAIIKVELKGAGRSDLLGLLKGS